MVLALVPKTLAVAPIFIIPALINVAPVYVFAPDKVKVPVPVFVKAIAPAPITPEKVVELLSPPHVKVGVPDELLIIPAPAIDPTVSE